MWLSRARLRAGQGNSKHDPYFPPLNTANMVVRPETARQAPPAFEPGDSTRGAHPIIGATRCELKYAVENLIPGSQLKIEFWATRDNGRNWMRLLDESAGHSPARLVLPGDGDFGISIKATGSGQPPHAEEAPDAWIEVDTTPPTLRMMPPTIGTGANAGNLTIQWMAHDKNLVADSVSIYHASRPEGPWVPIVTGLRNEGDFRWRIPPGIGADIYLRRRGRRPRRQHRPLRTPRARCTAPTQGPRPGHRAGAMNLRRLRLSDSHAAKPQAAGLTLLSRRSVPVSKPHTPLLPVGKST